MSLQILIVNNDRFIINTLSKSCEDTCNTIIDSYPDDAIVEFGEVLDSDLQKK